jgi:hypothetical protein
MSEIKCLPNISFCQFFSRIYGNEFIIERVEFLKITKEMQYQIFETVWLDGHEGIDGMTTAAIANKFGISTAQTYRILIQILKGKCTVFPFKYDDDYDGVVVSTGRIFVRNGEEKERGKGHSYWFYA